MMNNQETVANLLISNFKYTLKYKDRKLLNNGEVDVVLDTLKNRVRFQTRFGMTLGCIMLVLGGIQLFNPNIDYINFVIGTGSGIWCIYFVNKQKKRSKLIFNEAKSLMNEANSANT